VGGANNTCLLSGDYLNACRGPFSLSVEMQKYDDSLVNSLVVHDKSGQGQAFVVSQK
jgi:hypothetical protein